MKSFALSAPSVSWSRQIRNKAKSVLRFLACSKLFRKQSYLPHPPRKKTNKISTCKYTVLSFLPKCLAFQFFRCANIYFLCVGILQLFPQFSSTNQHIPTVFVPLTIVILVSSIKELIEDLGRYKSDKEENNRKVKVFSKGELIERCWKNLRVNDIVKLKRNDRIPADIVVLGSSGDSATCYVETKSFDGETNLKHKICLPVTARLFTSDAAASHLEVHLSCEEPSAALTTFHGVLESITAPANWTEETSDNSLARRSTGDTSASLDPHDIEASAAGSPGYEQRNSIETRSRILVKGPIPVTMQQFLFRGCSLMNTDWIYGVVVYVSTDTRIFQNVVRNGQSLFKTSHLEKCYNHHVLILILFELIFCFFICIGAILFPRSEKWYLFGLQRNQPDDVGRILEVFASVLILFVYFVPLDLFLTLEIVRLLQGCFVSWDHTLSGDAKAHSVVHSSHLLEELGGATHLFTDKTGTLTENCMKFRCVSAGGLEIPAEADTTEEKETESNIFEEPYHFVFPSSSAFSALSLGDWYAAKLNQKVYPCAQEREKVRLFFLGLAICHTVLIRHDNHDLSEECEEEPNHKDLLPAYVTPTRVLLERRTIGGKVSWCPVPEAVYDAASPDELAFVAGAQECGVELYNRPSRRVVQLRLLTQFAQKWIMQPALYDKWLSWLDSNAGNKRVLDDEHQSIWVPIIDIELLNIFEFDAERRRMSVIIRDPVGADSPLRVLVKGADTQMLHIALLDGENDARVEKLIGHVQDFARKGLRTLIFAARILPEAEHSQLTEHLLNIRLQFVKHHQKDQAALTLSELCNTIEQNVDLTGATGVEDKLQQDVPQVLRNLRLCGIRCWMLTGDKPETAINVAHSARLLTSTTYNPVLDGTKLRIVRQQLAAFHVKCVASGLLPAHLCSAFDKQELPDAQRNTELRSSNHIVRFDVAEYSKANTFPLGSGFRNVFQNYGRGLSSCTGFDGIGDNEKMKILKAPSVSTRKRMLTVPAVTVDVIRSIHRTPSKTKTEFSSTECSNQRTLVADVECRLATEYAITVTGAALDVMLEDAVLMQTFSELAVYAAVVVACRMSPKQKALLVNKCRELTLSYTSTVAIGDGANDVPMICSAHVGIGIVGKEGLEAARSADFGIRNFRALQRLLFVHGREALRRNSFLVYYGIFKNLSLCMVTFFFQFFSGFSGTELYNFWFKSLYTTVFVSPVIILFCVFDRELPHQVLQHCCITYRSILPSVMWPFIAPGVRRVLLSVLKKLNPLRFCQLCRRFWFRFFLSNAKKEKIKPRESSWEQLGSSEDEIWDLQSIKRHRAYHWSNDRRKKQLVETFEPVCYGYSLLYAWFVYALYVGVILTTFTLFVSADIKTGSSYAVFKSGGMAHRYYAFGFDLPAVGMAVLFQCILIASFIVLLAMNSMFPFQLVVMVGVNALYLGLWALASWHQLKQWLPPGFEWIRGTFYEMWASFPFYLCFVLPILLCLLPVVTARVICVQFWPDAVTVLKEHIFCVYRKKGVKVVEEDRKKPRLSLFPNRVDDEEVNALENIASRRATAFIERRRNATLCRNLAASTGDAETPVAALEQPIALPLFDLNETYMGFAFSYEDTLLSLSSFMWVLAGVTRSAAKIASTPLFRLTRDMSQPHETSASQQSETL